ncbi:FAR1 domain-containing protein [Cephalotus follicularis]|uniref:FAR1 domain-containing protein n=1 Tax=Cephalotus follicularis TaxID=3775 RepID=A0A1Q3CJY0_CEPFO|nr:FAR1 domain-containing protein [Cephalotus follicularis]
MSRKIGEMTRRVFVCNKQGTTHLVHTGKEVRRHRETRTGCMAKMEISVTETGEWIIHKFNNDHNHFISPSKVTKHRSHKKMHRLKACRSLMYKLRKAVFRPSQISKTLNVLSSSQEENITSQQCSDYLRLERKNNVGQECYEIIKYFQEKAAVDESYYFTMDLA